METCCTLTTFTSKKYIANDTVRLIKRNSKFMVYILPGIEILLVLWHLQTLNFNILKLHVMCLPESCCTVPDADSLSAELIVGFTDIMA